MKAPKNPVIQRIVFHTECGWSVSLVDNAGVEDGVLLVVTDPDNNAQRTLEAPDTSSALWALRHDCTYSRLGHEVYAEAERICEG